MSSLVDDPAHDERPRHGTGLPPIGIWWPMLERPLQREVLENLEAPLRGAVVQRIYDLCELERRADPPRRRPTRCQRAGLHRGLDARRRLGLTPQVIEPGRSGSGATSSSPT